MSFSISFPEGRQQESFEISGFDPETGELRPLKKFIKPDSCVTASCNVSLNRSCGNTCAKLTIMAAVKTAVEKSGEQVDGIQAVADCNGKTKDEFGADTCGARGYVNLYDSDGMMITTHEIRPRGSAKLPHIELEQ